MRLLGILILSLIPITIGILKYLSLSRECRILSEFKKLTHLTAGQMRYSLNEPSVILEFIKSSPQCSKEMEKIIGVILEKSEYSEIFSSIEGLGDCVLPKRYVGAVSDMFYSLGRSDLEGQLSNLDYFSALFTAEEERAKERFQKKGRLYIGLAFSLSALVFIILI